MRRVGLAAVLAAVVFVGYSWWSLPDVHTVVQNNPKTTAMIEARKAEAAQFKQRYVVSQRWVSLDRVNHVALEAILLSEDANFYGHHGVDWHEVSNAAQQAIDAGKLQRGASTITQQVAKNLWLSGSRSVVRKAKEMWLAHQMENAMPKKRILTLYVNIAEWGNGVFGIEAAARAHFGANASELTVAQAAMLASMLPAPRKWTPASKSKTLYLRSSRLAEKLAAVGKISAEEARQALSDLRVHFGLEPAPDDHEEPELEESDD